MAVAPETTAIKARRGALCRWGRRVAVGVVLSLLVAMIVHGLVPGRTPDANPTRESSRHRVVALFGATGTVGDGVLEALLADPDVETIHVVTRRTSARIEGADAAGRVTVHLHEDYLDYTALAEVLPALDAVYWALGTSAVNVDDAQYTAIHVDFPVAFMQAWLAGDGDGDGNGDGHGAGDAEAERSFHLVTGQGTSAEGWQHWARAKARAERELFAAAEGSAIRVIAYRPTYVVPSKLRAGWAQGAAHTVLSPFDLATRSTDIGRAMLEVTARGSVELPNGTVLENKDLLEYTAAYRGR